MDEGVGYGGVRPVDSSHRCLLWAESNRFIQRSLTLFLSTVVLDVLSIVMYGGIDKYAGDIAFQKKNAEVDVELRLFCHSES